MSFPCELGLSDLESRPPLLDSCCEPDSGGVFECGGEAPCPELPPPISVDRIMVTGLAIGPDGGGGGNIELL